MERSIENPVAVLSAGVQLNVTTLPTKLAESAVGVPGALAAGVVTVATLLDAESPALLNATTR